MLCVSFRYFSLTTYLVGVQHYNTGVKNQASQEVKKGGETKED